ncbi:MAG TPA: hypothetical protein V6C81_31745 [Planktothrix sp.]|jgi:hypothetical protein
MIVYFVTQAHGYTMRNFLEYWAPELYPMINLAFFEELFDLAAKAGGVKLPHGTYIFTDVDRLSPTQREVACAVARKVKAVGLPILNDPERVLDRFELSKLLYKQGINSFDVYRANEKPDRFPVFFRHISQHVGSITNPIPSQPDLDACRAYLHKHGFIDSDLMSVEYIHGAGADGIFRKYGCQIVGDMLIADHLFFSSQWITRFFDDSATDEMLEEERAYVFAEQNPHEAELRQVFQLANIQYGRVDYGIIDGKIQIWEINSNPMITGPPEEVSPRRLQLKNHVHDLLKKSFVKLDGSAPN